MYVTPARFKTMGFGIDLTDVEDFAIRAKLQAASERVNAITAAPGAPQPHDFRGGTITDERHQWRVGDGITTPPSRSIYVWHYPLLTVTSMQIDLTNNRYITIAEDERYLTRRTIEIVSLAMTANGIFGAAVLPEIGLLKPQVKLTYTYGYSIPRTDEVLEPTDGLTYQAPDQWWDSSVTPTVKVDGTTLAAVKYSVDYDEGTITILDNDDAGAVVTASYTTTLPRAISYATGILASEALGDREMRERGMTGLRSIQVGEISIEKDQPMRGGQTLVSPALAEAEQLLAPFRFISAGA